VKAVGPGEYTIKDAEHGQYIYALSESDDEVSADSDGLGVATYSSLKGKVQKWLLKPDGSGKYVIQNKENDRRLYGYRRWGADFVVAGVDPEDGASKSLKWTFEWKRSCSLFKCPDGHVPDVRKRDSTTLSTSNCCRETCKVYKCPRGWLTQNPSSTVLSDSSCCSETMSNCLDHTDKTQWTTALNPTRCAKSCNKERFTFVDPKGVYCTCDWHHLTNSRTSKQIPLRTYTCSDGTKGECATDEFCALHERKPWPKPRRGGTAMACDTFKCGHLVETGKVRPRGEGWIGTPGSNQWWLTRDYNHHFTPCRSR